MVARFDKVINRPARRSGRPAPVALRPAAPCCAPGEPDPCVDCVPELPIVGGEPILPRDIDPCVDAELLGALEDPDLWPDWTDSWLWTSDADQVEVQESFDADTARDYLDRSDTLSLDELVEYQAAFYRSWPNAAGALIAQALTELALKIRLVDARTPADFEARVEVLDADMRRQWEEVGFAAGRDSCPCHVLGANGFGHMA